LKEGNRKIERRKRSNDLRDDDENGKKKERQIKTIERIKIKSLSFINLFQIQISDINC